MAKKSKTQFDRYKAELIKYIWESLRTNPEYIKDYERYKTNDKRYWMNDELFFNKKYGIIPLDPSVPFPDKKPRATSSKKQFAQRVLWLYFINIVRAVTFLSEYPKQDKNRRLSAKNRSSTEIGIPVTINLNAPLSQIIAEITDIVQVWQGNKKLKTLRHRLNEYKNYFRAHDLSNKGLSWEEIAKKCYPHEEDTNYAKRKVKRDCKRWKKIGLFWKDDPVFGCRMSYSESNATLPQLLTHDAYLRRLAERHKHDLKS